MSWFGERQFKGHLNRITGKKEKCKKVKKVVDKGNNVCYHKSRRLKRRPES